MFNIYYRTIKNELQERPLLKFLNLAAKNAKIAKKWKADAKR